MANKNSLPLLLALIGTAAASSDASSCTPVDMAAVPGAEIGQLSQPGNPHASIPFTGNPNPACTDKTKPCPFVDTAAECRAGCVAAASCTTWSVFANCNTGPKPPGGRTKHSCLLQNLTAVSNDGDGLYISGTLTPLPPANVWPNAGGGPPKGCVGNLSSLPFCDASLGAAQRAKLLSELLTVTELANCMNDEMPAIDRLGIQPYRYGHEGLHGYLQPCPVAGTWGKGGKCFTDFPTSSAAVASFNRSLWHAIGSAEADEARGTYNAGFGRGIGNGHEGFGLHIRGPQLNPQRDPRWGRNQNSPGEDAFTNGEYGAYIVWGAQGSLLNGTYPHGEYRKVLREMKHFTAYSVEAGRNSAGDDWNITLKDLDEYYFPPLRACVKADVGAFMCSYNSINGTASCGNVWMNDAVVRKHWNWTGVIETDCQGMMNPNMCGNHTADGPPVGPGDQNAGTCPGGQAHAVRALQATVDIACQGDFGTLPNASNYSEVTVAQMQQAVARVFKGRFQIGEFDPNETAYADIDASTVFSAAHQQLSLEAAEQSIVLVHNAPYGAAAHLPLKRGLKLALIGPNADDALVYQGQYYGPSCPEQPANSGYAGCLPTALSAITAANTGGTTQFVSGCTNAQNCNALANQSAVKAAVAAADVVLLILGEAIGVTNQEGVDRQGYKLAGQQTALAQLVGTLGKPTVVIMLSGGAVGMEWIASQTAWPLLVPGYSGIFGPDAIAKTLFGDVAPSGMLPYTVYPDSWDENCKGNNQGDMDALGDAGPVGPGPTCRNEIQDMGMTSGDGRTYRWYGYQNRSLQATIPFGTAEYYTDFSVVAAQHPPRADKAATTATTVAVTIRNGGETASRCRIMLFAKPVALSQAAPLPLPVKSIVDFSGTDVLSPGATETLTFDVTLDALSLTDWAGKRAAYKGTYELLVSIGNGTAASVPLSLAATTVLDHLPPPPQR